MKLNLKQRLIHWLMKKLYPNREDRAMALLCEGARELEISEAANANTVSYIHIEPESDSGYYVSWK